ncbi:MAG: M14 family zinc carboxypeptidase [bacterium]
MRLWLLACVCALSALGVVRGDAAFAAEPPFFPGGTYDPAIPTPESVLGFAVASRPARHDEVVRYFEAVAAATPRVVVAEYARSHEKRALIYAIVSSEKNMARREEIQKATARLADPRGLSAGDESSIVAQTPATVWLAYGIHGDEISSTDAAIQFLYQLAAGTDTLTVRLRDELLIGIDPMENTDGRERYLSMLTAVGGAVPNADVQSLQHRGYWPWGRGNHYLFDLNRDWFYLVHPESRGRVATILDWHPVMLVDSHEMGALDTYLFSPARAPFNPNIREEHHEWWKVFAADQARAFDRYGWPYYTREWSEDWFPGYGSSWPIYTGLVGILYEQAGADGSPVRQRDGTVLTYRETVHHQFVSSIANCETAARHREPLLREYVALKRRGIAEGVSGPVRAYIVDASKSPDRAATFIERMLLQDIEVLAADDAFRASGLRDTWGRTGVARDFPKGTLIVRLDQPMKAFIHAILEFDPTLPDSFLKEERHYLEKFSESRLYETTSWSLPLTYGLDAYMAGAAPGVATTRVTAAVRPPGAIVGGASNYGYLIDAAEDAAGLALAHAHEAGLVTRASDKEFTVSGRRYARGTLLFTSRANPDSLEAKLARIARDTGVTVHPASTALAESGPDLGGNEFHLLTQPRIGLVGGSGVDFTQYGALWHLLDKQYGMRISNLDIASVGDIDLSKYNVLIFPNAYGGGGAYRGALREGGIARVRDWIEAGGTFVGISAGATFAADSTVALSSVRPRWHALSAEIPEWPWEKRAREAAAKKSAASKKDDGGDKPAGGGEKDSKALEAKEEMARRFAPQGAFLRVDLDTEHWLTSGYGEKVAAHYGSQNAFIAEEPEHVVGRFAQAESLRVAGLLWPEARERLARTAWLTREGLGKGQVILFADSPVFRGAARGLERLLTNALFIAPGAGASRPTPW